MRYGKTSLTISAAAIGALLAAGGGAAVGSPHAPASLISTPKYSVTITAHKSGPTMKVVGPHTISAGRIAVSLKAVGDEEAVEVIRIKSGYSYKKAQHDFGLFAQSFQSNSGPTKAQLAALGRVVHNVIFYGGLDSGSLSSERGTLMLRKPGHYLMVNDEQGPGPNPFKITVTAKVGNRAVPKVAAKVWAITAKRFRGDTTLPATGTIKFKNKSTQSPHFLVLQHVKNGTTRKQVIKALNSTSSGPPPSWFKPENADTDVVGMGHAITLHYHLPPGEYVEMCFFPDLKTGMPHAAMGMVRVVHLV